MTKRLIGTSDDEKKDAFSSLCIDLVDKIILLLNDDKHKHSEVVEVLRLVNRLFFQRVVALVWEYIWNWNYRRGIHYVKSWPYIKKLTVYAGVTQPDTGFEKLNHLTYLGIFYSAEPRNYLFKVPLVSLKKLTIYGYAIRNEEFLCLTGLVSLIFINTNTEEYKPIRNIGLLTDLRKLSLCDNNAVHDDDLMLLTNLTTLELDHNEYITNKSVSNLTNLTRLSLAYNNNITFDALKNLRELTVLDLSYSSHIKSEELGQMTNLRRLKLYANSMIESKDLVKLTQLTALDVSYNKLITSEAVGALKNLVELDICGNSNVRREEITSLPVLEKLYVDGVSNLMALNFTTKKNFTVYLT